MKKEKRLQAPNNKNYYRKDKENHFHIKRIKKSQSNHKKPQSCG